MKTLKSKSKQEKKLIQADNLRQIENIRMMLVLQYGQKFAEFETSDLGNYALWQIAVLDTADPYDHIYKLITPEFHSKLQAWNFALDYYDPTSKHAIYY